ncbi:DUF7502 family protein [Methanosarcina mazei]|uniref:Uncharacterized protein n=4 Tax=Methanosarcina mazei TaxID=2209 RepID=A0A0F8SJ60_METMZ|nr:hypothetical protein [Methanosarcina mazei]AKB39912.1 hypothetical protein MSMAW_0921 [Methanosarcina mazei WWM610]AKB70824.1 hypothetical protein MSMAC_0934 [Methanosarcina mazei C16]KKF98831.1 hypothetical protein DU47_07785 [Methanosarcina mazei]KKG05308.1 hypothetical protein DU31_14255 [Methanosarcina mazei]KKG05519.1 hypothetical protein DU40_08480 [Methanosarcina mazei]
MALEIEKIVNKHESALKKYRGLYVFADLLATFLVLYALFVLLNMRDIFLMFPTFEPYTGAKYSILGSEIVFETLGLIITGFILSLILTAIRHLRAEKKDAISFIEEKYPVLKERMRTAYDNRNTDNIIVRDLIGGVIIDSRPVNSSVFLNRKKLAKDVLVTVFAVVVLAYVAQTGYQTTFSPTDFSEVIENLPFAGSNSDLVSVEENGGTSSDPQDNSELFGEPAVIVVEGKDVDLKIPPGAGQGFTSQEEGEQNNESFIQSDIYNPEAIASQSYYENLPEGYRSVIQSYFEQLAEE